jgi:hypothetical protein
VLPWFATGPLVLEIETTDRLDYPLGIRIDTQAGAA